MDLSSLKQKLSTILESPEFTQADGQLPSISTFKKALSEADQILDTQFKSNESDIHSLISARSYWIDLLLTKAWIACQLSDINITLVAVGGYGRGELHPQSDIDILLLAEEDRVFTDNIQHIESFIQRLWDIGLKVGQSVRTIHECYEEATKDLTIITNMMESRTITGPNRLTENMQSITSPENIWPSSVFFTAKQEEQSARHKKFRDIEYNMEPNIKGSPGGLRDFQTISWMVRRHYGNSSIDSMINHKIVSTPEAAIIRNGITFLWKLRYALHIVARRPEDSLLFDYQRAVADIMGYEDDSNRLAIEQMMRDYHRVTTALSELRDLLLQHLNEEILEQDTETFTRRINSRFQVKNNRIEITDSQLFQKHPVSILEIFLLMARDSSIEGARAGTIRQLREHRHLIDETFRQTKINTHIFIDILNTNNPLLPEVIRMAQYGVLGRYLPEYGSIIGVMQHDLFHAYTVDAHTLQCVRIIHRLFHEPDINQFPLASSIIQKIPNINLLYIAALLHHTGMSKGTNRDHNEYSVMMALNFCERHQLPREDKNMIAWLVRNHMLMGNTSQRADISDPEEVLRFCSKVRSQTHLDYLYLFTVADINATNPTLWTSWRASLLTQLHQNASRLIGRNDSSSTYRQEWIEETRKKAMNILKEQGLQKEEVYAHWVQNTEEYFLRETPENIAWHTKALHNHDKHEGPLVLIKKDGGHRYAGGTQIFICTLDRPGLFTLIAATLDRLHLSVQDARILPTVNEYTYDTYTVLGENGQPIHNAPERIQTIRKELKKVLADPSIAPPKIQRRTSRQLKHFASPCQVILSSDCSKKYSNIEIIAPDRPGLLALIGSILLEHNVYPHSAKILTLGEKVEDLFFVTDENDQPLDNPEFCIQLQQALSEGIDEFVENKTY